MTLLLSTSNPLRPLNPIGMLQSRLHKLQVCSLAFKGKEFGEIFRTCTVPNFFIIKRFFVASKFFINGRLLFIGDRKILVRARPPGTPFFTALF